MAWVLVSCDGLQNSIEVKMARDAAAADCDTRGTCIKDPRGLLLYNPDLLTENLVLRQQKASNGSDSELLLSATKLKPLIKGINLVGPSDSCDSPKGVDGANPTLSSLLQLKEGIYKACIAYVGEGLVKRSFALEFFQVDATPPKVAGGLSYDSLTSNSVSLNWSKPGDNLTIEGKLIYTFYTSRTRPLGSLSDVKEFGNIYQSQLLGGVSFTLKNMEPNTPHYAAVVVSDEAGNESLVGSTYFQTQVSDVTEPPLALPPPGIYSTTQSISLSSATPEASIYYTVDGSTPTTSSTPYTGPIAVLVSQTIKAISVKSNFTDSTAQTFGYTITGTVQAPTFSVAAGSYGPVQTLTLNSATPGATIYYTTNGNTPTTSSTQYLGAITVSTSQTIKAIAVLSDWADSSVSSAAYTINGAVATPAFSLASGHYSTPKTVTVSSLTPDAEVHFTIDGSTPSCASPSGSVIVMSSMTVKAVACKSGYVDSDQVSAHYTMNIISPLAVEAFPDTTNYPEVSWVPSVSFSIESPASVGFYSDTFGTAIKLPTGTSIGGNTFSLDPEPSSGVTKRVYARSEVNSEYVDLGSYKTRLPPNFSLPLPMAGDGSSVRIHALIKDSLSSGCIMAPHCMIVGGAFQYLQHKLVNNIARLRPDGSIEPLGSGLNAQVNSLVIDSSGSIYAGGNFSSSGEVSAKAVAKWDGTSWSSLGVGVTGAVKAMAFDQAGHLYVGGDNTSVAGLPNSRIIKWDGLAWNAINAPAVGGISALLFDASGNLYAAGSFTMIGGVSARGVAQWDGVNWAPLGDGVSNVYSLALDNSDNLYAGGLGGITKWNGSSWGPLGSGLSGRVNALAVDADGYLYAGGWFTCTNGATSSGTYPENVCSGAENTTAFNNIARWDGTAWHPLDTGFDGFVYAVHFGQNGILYAGGQFWSAGGSQARALAKWNGSKWLPTGRHIDDQILAMVTDSAGNLYVGGFFTTVGGLPVKYVAKWNGSEWSSLGRGLNGAVYALTLDSSGNVYAAGHFTRAGDVAANNIAKWDGSTWVGLGDGVNGGVSALAFDPTGKLYAGGEFTSSGVEITSNIAVWNGISWSALGAGVNGPIFALKIDSEGGLYAAGRFSLAGITSANNVAQWNGSSWAPLGAGTNGEVFALAMDVSSNLYVGGTFSAAGSIAASDVARWNGSSWAALGGGISGGVNALSVDATGALYAGGYFELAGSAAAKQIAKWDGASWVELGGGVRSVDGWFSPGVFALTHDPAGNMYVGGSFTATATLIRPFIAKWITKFSSWF